jgi:hypothetical protein
MRLTNNAPLKTNLVNSNTTLSKSFVNSSALPYSQDGFSKQKQSKIQNQPRFGMNFLNVKTITRKTSELFKNPARSSKEPLGAIARLWGDIAYPVVGAALIEPPAIEAVHSAFVDRFKIDSKKLPTNSGESKKDAFYRLVDAFITEREAHLSNPQINTSNKDFAAMYLIGSKQDIPDPGTSIADIKEHLRSKNKANVHIVSDEELEPRKIACFVAKPNVNAKQLLERLQPKISGPALAILTGRYQSFEKSNSALKSSEEIIQHEPPELFSGLSEDDKTIMKFIVKAALANQEPVT